MCMNTQIFPEKLIWWVRRLELPREVLKHTLLTNLHTQVLANYCFYKLLSLQETHAMEKSKRLRKGNKCDRLRRPAHVVNTSIIPSMILTAKFGIKNASRIHWIIIALPGNTMQLTQMRQQ